jgi:4-methyl-5(b-hydroxyethyl)-thiazole monophosphate biosynthesis
MRIPISWQAGQKAYIDLPPALPLPPTRLYGAEAGHTLTTKVCSVQRLEKSGIFILVASGFEETEVSAVTRALRRSGLAVALVGLTAGPVRGAYGVSLMPDRALSEVGIELPRAVVLPNGVQGVRQLATDPRVHRLLHQTVDQGGYVLALGTADIVLHHAGVLDMHTPRSKDSSEEKTPARQVSMAGHVLWAHGTEGTQEAVRTLAALLRPGA